MSQIKTENFITKPQQFWGLTFENKVMEKMSEKLDGNISYQGWPQMVPRKQLPTPSQKHVEKLDEKRIRYVNCQNLSWKR